MFCQIKNHTAVPDIVEPELIHHKNLLFCAEVLFYDFLQAVHIHVLREHLMHLSFLLQQELLVQLLKVPRPLLAFIFVTIWLNLHVEYWLMLISSISFLSRFLRKFHSCSSLTNISILLPY